jgi:hypothetical protein
MRTLFSPFLNGYSLDSMFVMVLPEKTDMIPLVSFDAVDFDAEQNVSL